MQKPIAQTFLILCCSLISVLVSADGLPDGFVYVRDVIPDIREDIRYFADDNFVGNRIDGYEKPVSILTKDAAIALKAVQSELSAFGLGLQVYDAYRPQQAVDHFVRWARDLDDTRMKSRYYPDVAKQDLFRLGYIAAKSGHSRGSTVDLTIVSNDNFKALDMGTTWDHFGPESWPSYSKLTASQRANRMLLHNVMLKHGFKPLQEEWWHFTLANEPFPDTYFDFVVE